MHLRATGMRLIAAAVALLGAAASLAASQPAFLSPARGEALAPGAVVHVEWRSACESDIPPGFDEAELVLSLDGGLTYPIRVSRELDPCESTLAWRVPTIPTDSARLALRMGEASDGESEELAEISDTFRILSDPDGRAQALVPRAGEWGVAPETEVVGAHDRLGRSLRSPAERLTAPSELVVFSLPSAGAAVVLDRRVARLATARAAGLRRPASVPEAPIGAPTPLRL
jgi:hypothetical protein